jgi:hypothetical protein
MPPIKISAPRAVKNKKEKEPKRKKDRKNPQPCLVVPQVRQWKVSNPSTWSRIVPQLARQEIPHEAQKSHRSIPCGLKRT